MDVLDYQDMLVFKFLGLELGLQNQLACRLRPCVTLAPHELMSMTMLNFLDQVRKEHECALKHADNHQVQLPFFLEDGGVILVDLAGQRRDDVLDVLLGVEQLEGEALMGDCCHVVK